MRQKDYTSASALSASACRLEWDGRRTTEMAQDVIELLDYVGWSAKRELHVVGVSMGGMVRSMASERTKLTG